MLALEIPRDLAEALDAYPVAGRFFDAFPPSSQRIILKWIAGARRSETRLQRIDATVRLAAQNVRAHHWRSRERASPWRAAVTRVELDPGYLDAASGTITFSPAFENV